MTGDNNAKADEATAPQSPIVRHLGLIKAMSVIMAILIVAALVVIVVTIYSRLTVMENSAEPRQSSITLPAGALALCSNMPSSSHLQGCSIAATCVGCMGRVYFLLCYRAQL